MCLLSLEGRKLRSELLRCTFLKIRIFKNNFLSSSKIWIRIWFLESVESAESATFRSIKVRLKNFILGEENGIQYRGQSDLLCIIKSFKTLFFYFRRTMGWSLSTRCTRGGARNLQETPSQPDIKISAVIIVTCF